MKKAKIVKLIKDTEKRNPLGQKQLAKQLGVSTRTLRYWKTGERKPTKTHTSKLKAKHNIMKSYVKSVAKARHISQREAIKISKRHYRKLEKTDIPDVDKWIPVYKPDYITMILKPAKGEEDERTELEKRLGLGAP